MADQKITKAVAPPGDATRLANEAGQGNAQAAEALLTAVYDELHRLASARLARERQHTLQTTALVHEVYLRLVGDQGASWRNRGHFFGAAAEAMRRILVERARRRATARHGGGRQRVELFDSIAAEFDDHTDILALNEALDRLQEQSPRKAELVKLRYFAGMSIAQAAAAMDISHATAERYWTYSRLRLFQWMTERE